MMLPQWSGIAKPLTKDLQRLNLTSERCTLPALVLAGIRRKRRTGIAKLLTKGLRTLNVAWERCWTLPAVASLAKKRWSGIAKLLSKG